MIAMMYQYPQLHADVRDRAIERAPFLTEEQKRDVLFDNAARFLGLHESSR
jgi:hypothetical protein